MPTQATSNEDLEVIRQSRQHTDMHNSSYGLSGTQTIFSNDMSGTIAVHSQTNLHCQKDKRRKVTSPTDNLPDNVSDEDNSTISYIRSLIFK